MKAIQAIVLPMFQASESGRITPYPIRMFVTYSTFVVDMSCPSAKGRNT